MFNMNYYVVGLCVVQAGRHLDGAEYQKKIVPCVVKLFSSSERSTRVNLLQQVCTHIYFLRFFSMLQNFKNNVKNLLIAFP